MRPPGIVACPRAMSIGLVHPDLGLGGAERLVVDVAVGLGARGHDVEIVTAAHDPGRSFAETVDGRVRVQVVRPPFPSRLLQRLRAPLAVLRMAHLCRHGDLARFEVLVCDGVAHVVPLLKRRTGRPVVYYCHFPDLLLTGRRSRLYDLYRRPIDRQEAKGLLAADLILVNSRYTGTVLHQTFPALPEERVRVLHPGVRVREPLPPPSGDGPAMFLCIGRVVPEKNLGLAIEALNAAAARAARPLTLAIAGGFDPALAEQRAALAALETLGRRLGVASQVSLYPSASETVLGRLLEACTAVLYTPPCEHFGLVPLEAMAAGRPVLAVDAGGPRETVIHGETGFLLPGTPDAFAEHMALLAREPERTLHMGRAAHEHVRRCFTRERFAAELEHELGGLVPRSGSEVTNP